MQVIENKSFEFAVKIIELYRYLVSGKKEYVLSKQILRSGTSIGANVCEAEDGISKAEFISKMSIALKEASETVYWLRLLEKSNFLVGTNGKELLNECIEIRKILSKIVKTAKENQERETKKGS